MVEEFTGAELFSFAVFHLIKLVEQIKHKKKLEDQLESVCLFALAVQRLFVWESMTSKFRDFPDIKECPPSAVTRRVGSS